MTQAHVSGWGCWLPACLSVPMSPFPQKSALPVSAGSRSRAGAGQRWRCGRWTRTLWLSHLSPHCTPSIPISRNWTVFWALSSKAGCWSEDLDFLCQYFLEGEVFVECIWWQLVLHCSHLYFVFCCVLSFLKFSFLFYFYLAGCSQPQLGSSVHYWQSISPTLMGTHICFGPEQTLREGGPNPGNFWGMKSWFLVFQTSCFSDLQAF